MNEIALVMIVIAVLNGLSLPILAEEKEVGFDVITNSKAPFNYTIDPSDITHIINESTHTIVTDNYMLARHEILLANGWVLEGITEKIIEIPVENRNSVGTRGLVLALNCLPSSLITRMLLMVACDFAFLCVFKP